MKDFRIWYENRRRARQILRLLDANGVTWSDGRSLFEYDGYDVEGYFNCNDGKLTHGSFIFDFIENGYSKITYQELLDLPGIVIPDDEEDENAIYCEYCGDIIPEGEEQEFDGEVYCQYCFDNLFTECDECGEIIRQYDSYGDGNTTLCEYCYNEYYVRCVECDELIHRDDAYYDDWDNEWYCRDCWNDKSDRVIHDYGYKPAPEFFGNDSTLYMGVELEIDKGGEDHGNAEKIVDIMGDNFIYCKHDGSINDGFEIVSHPATLDYHTKKAKWEEMMQKAIEMDYRGHNTSTCGLHIHVNRNYFGSDYDTQEEVIARIIYFVELHWNEIMKFTRRTPENISRWASRYGISKDVKNTYEDVKSKDFGRYVAVNLKNYNTIEFRIFRSTLKYNTFVATLQFVSTICELCKVHNNKDIEALSWTDFVKMVTSPELIQYLKERQLYVNDEIITEEEF